MNPRPGQTCEFAGPEGIRQMTTVIQGQPSGDNSGAMAVGIVVVLILGVVMGIAYMNGFFRTNPAPSTTVIENTTVERHDTVVIPVEVPASDFAE
jgi:hypothetical protein